MHVFTFFVQTSDWAELEEKDTCTAQTFHTIYTNESEAEAKERERKRFTGRESEREKKEHTKESNEIGCGERQRRNVPLALGSRIGNSKGPSSC